MAIQGYFQSVGGELPAPYVEAGIYLLRSGAVGVVNFLIDTGADVTCLHPEDMRVMRIDRRLLTPGSLNYPRGIGGVAGYYREPALLLFPDRDRGDTFCQLAVNIYENPEDPAMERAPSLLGRDFLNRCDLRLNRSQTLARLEPVNVADTAILPAE